MHNNFYFLRQVTASLEKRLRGAVVSECFSQNKDELVIRFETASTPFLIKAILTPAFSALSFPEEFHRAKKNSIDLFNSIIGRRVISLRQFENERSFLINFSDSIALLFKMHGNQSNIIAFEKNAPIELFRSQLVADQTIDPEKLDRHIDWSFEHFIKCKSNLNACYFTFGKSLWEHLKSRGFDNKPDEEKWKTIVDLKTKLEDPTFFISEVKGVIKLLLVEEGNIIRSHTDAVAASNDFYHLYIERSAYDRERQTLISRIQTAIASTASYIAKTKDKLNTVQQDNNYKIWADLVMANLHRIPPRSESVTVENFYNNNQALDIKLKVDHSPQKNAEIFYRKAKNQQIEIDRLTRSMDAKMKELDQLRQSLQDIEGATDLKKLRTIGKTEAIPQKKQDGPSLPYHEFEFKGFRILIGKNAQANDELTLKYSFKDDLWLHAKDVSGSHVLIKHQSGKNFPKDVIEHAAELAAYHSKRKNDSLCPVIVTPKKFVRKRKGDPAGLVVVEKEQVLMVVPRKP